VAPDLEHESVMLVFLQEVMRSDLLSTQFSLNAPASSYPTVDEKFDVISYAKGMNFCQNIKVYQPDSRRLFDRSCNFPHGKKFRWPRGFPVGYPPIFNQIASDFCVCPYKLTIQMPGAHNNEHAV